MDPLGFVGLGSMGGAIAARIARSGLTVLGIDRDAGGASRNRVASQPNR